MSAPLRRAGRSLPVLLLLPVLTTCETEKVTSSVLEPVGFSRAYGVWQPGPTDTCTAEIHDRYSTVGPDGLVYPTWHPPVDRATGCTFGHEHGRDPRGSHLFEESGPIPFGYANQVLDAHDPHGPRHEDHVGHKIEWENDFKLSFSGGAGAVLDITCDVLTKLHQGSHSKDAFTNNLHELVYHLRCSDGTALRVTLMTAIGTPGEMVVSCDRERHIQVGVATPPTSPNGNGKRAIPDRSCIDRFMLMPPGERSNFGAALRESWEVHSRIRSADGRIRASFDPYYQVEMPSRFYDPSKPGGVGRPLDVCFEVRPDGARAQGEACDRSTGGGSLAGIGYDDPRSLFNGVRRFVDINNNRLYNSDGPEVWYTDPFGQNGRTEPFPGSIRQYIAATDNTGRSGHGPVIGRNRDYGGPGVHAPN